MLEIHPERTIWKGPVVTEWSLLATEELVVKSLSVVLVLVICRCSRAI